MKTFKLHLIRHGVTEGNLQGLYIGSGTDLPLCQEGRAQLELSLIHIFARGGAAPGHLYAKDAAGRRSYNVE